MLRWFMEEKNRGLSAFLALSTESRVSFRIESAAEEVWNIRVNQVHCRAITFVLTQGRLRPPLSSGRLRRSRDTLDLYLVFEE